MLAKPESTLDASTTATPSSEDVIGADAAALAAPPALAATSATCTSATPAVSRPRANHWRGLSTCLRMVTKKSAVTSVFDCDHSWYAVGVRLESAT